MYVGMKRRKEKVCMCVAVRWRGGGGGGGGECSGNVMSKREGRRKETECGVERGNIMSKC